MYEEVMTVCGQNWDPKCANLDKYIDSGEQNDYYRFQTIFAFQYLSCILKKKWQIKIKKTANVF